MIKWVVDTNELDNIRYQLAGRLAKLVKEAEALESKED